MANPGPHIREKAVWIGVWIRFGYDSPLVSELRQPILGLKRGLDAIWIRFPSRLCTLGCECRKALYPESCWKPYSKPYWNPY